MKKTISLVFSAFALFSLISCGKRTCTVIWQNYDETVLETDEKVKKGELPQYDGVEPFREDDDDYHYVFSGWSPELTKVKKDTTFVAVFTALHKYRVSFYNGETLLYETIVIEGNAATYVGETPTKEEDDEFKYEFNGWDKELTSIQSNTIFVAQFKAVAKENWGPIISSYLD